jgi:hypothetical protein
LLAVGKEKQARRTLAVGAERNGRKLDGEFEKSLQCAATGHGTGDEGKGNVFDLFRTPNLRKKTLAVFFNWTVCGLCFYGLAQYMGEIGGNIFVNVASSGLIELPGAFLCIYLMEKFGRRNTLLSANLVTAVACLLITFLPQSESSSMIYPKINPPPPFVCLYSIIFLHCIYLFLVFNFLSYNLKCIYVCMCVCLCDYNFDMIYSLRDCSHVSGDEKRLKLNFAKFYTILLFIKGVFNLKPHNFL